MAEPNQGPARGGDAGGARITQRRRAFRAPFADVPGPFASATSDLPQDERPTADQERGMRAFWWDGFWANVPETVLVNYLGLYVVAFGGSDGQVGLIAALGSLSAALAFFPGARLVERWGHRKRIVLMTGGGLSRVALGCLALVPFFFSGDTAIWVVIGLVSLRAFAGYFAVPAWTSLTADVVPMGIRGRFFASRNFGMSLAALATAPLAGFLLDRYSGLAGWQIIWGLATGAAAVSTWCYARIPDPAPHRDVLPRERREGGRGAVAEILSDRNFVWYLAGTAAWNIALQAAGPFFNVYLAERLHASSLWIGFLAALPSVTGLAGLVYLGRMMDRRGTKWMLVASGLTIPFLPGMWVFINAPWQVIFPNGFSGVLWAGYNLAVLNMVMVMAPPARRARYAAAFQTVVFASAFVGPLVGSLIIAQISFRAVFAFSAVGRMVGTLIVLRLVQPEGRPAAGPAAAAAG
ncbi:MAG TPA: MFS transporter [Dehalococcoidia bacterium]|nr:MFS transporter [Dehalococcoidia bacterium]